MASKSNLYKVVNIDKYGYLTVIENGKFVAKAIKGLYLK